MNFFAQAEAADPISHDFNFDPGAGADFQRLEEFPRLRVVKQNINFPVDLFLGGLDILYHGLPGFFRGGVKMTRHRVLVSSVYAILILGAF